MIDRVLIDAWKKQDNSFTRFLFSGPTPDPAMPSSGETATVDTSQMKYGMC